MKGPKLMQQEQEEDIAQPEHSVIQYEKEGPKMV